MTAARVLLVLLGVLALSACGSARSTQSGGEPQSTATKVVPAIEAIDEPAPGAGWQSPPDKGDAEVHTTLSMCFSRGVKGDDQSECAPNPDQVEHLNQMEAEFEQAVQPAEGSTPRAIAQLRLPSLGPKARARFIVWRNDGGKLCVQTEELNGPNSGDGGPSGPCDPDNRCRTLCLESSGLSGRSMVFDYVLSGLIASEADDLRLTRDDGRVQDVALTGPVVPGFPKYRVFMLDLGHSDLYRRLELRQGDKLLAERQVPDAVFKRMRCAESSPPVLPSPDHQVTLADGCVERAAPK